MQRPGNWPGNMGGGQQYQDHPPFQGQMSSTTMGQWRMPGQDDGRMMRPATGTNPNNIGAPNSYNGAPMHVNIDSLIKQAVEEYMKNHPR